MADWKRERQRMQASLEGKLGDKEDKTKESLPQTCVINIKTEKALKYRRKSMKNERKTEECQKNA